MEKTPNQNAMLPGNYLDRGGCSSRKYATRIRNCDLVKVGRAPQDVRKMFVTNVMAAHDNRFHKLNFIRETPPNQKYATQQACMDGM